MSPTQRRFRPWEEEDVDISTHPQSTSTQILPPAQYQTKLEASGLSRPLQLPATVAQTDSKFTHDQGETSPLATSAPMPSVHELTTSRAQQSLQLDTHRRSFHTLRSRPGPPQLITTESNMSQGVGESSSRQSKPRTRNAPVACLSCKQKRRKVSRERKTMTLSPKTDYL